VFFWNSQLLGRVDQLVALSGDAQLQFIEATPRGLRAQEFKDAQDSAGI
jgi:hypothetical protein